MVYVRITEGLGNQFYKYAFGYSLAREIGHEMIIDLAGYKYDPRAFELDRYAINTKAICLATPKRNDVISRVAARIKRRFQIGLFYKMLIEEPKRYYRYEPVDCSGKKNVYVQGYWQNYRYFSKYEKEIRSQFTMRDMPDRIKMICDRLSSKNTVALHIRLGDYRVEDRIDVEYYHKAISHIQGLLQNPDIYVFCEENDIRSAHDLFDGYDVRYIVEEYCGLTDVEVFELMRSCRSQIISNSTYSWWAAWLNDYVDKKIIAPLVDHLDSEYYPLDWILIKAEHKKGIF